MREVIVHDVSGLSRLNPDRKAPIWWGILGLIVIEATVVAGFIGTYFYLQLANASWPPPGVEPPALFWPTVTLILLLCSTGTMTWASKALVAEKYRHFNIAVFASIALAGTVLVVRWQQFQAFPFRWDEHAYGSVLWTISGFHFAHVVSALIGTAVVGLLGLKRYFTPRRQIGVVVDTMYWNFVALVWIPLYLVLYWSPRWQ